MAYGHCLFMLALAMVLKKSSVLMNKLMRQKVTGYCCTNLHQGVGRYVLLLLLFFNIHYAAIPHTVRAPVPLFYFCITLICLLTPPLKQSFCCPSFLHCSFTDTTTIFIFTDPPSCCFNNVSYLIAGFLTKLT